MKHLPLGAKQRLSTYRKISIASWNHPRDPSTYSWLDLPVEAADAFLKTLPTPRPSLTHYVAKIVAHCLEEHPALNHVIRGGNLYRRGQTDVFITTLLKGETGYDLSGFVLRNVPQKDLSTLANESKIEAEKLKDGTDVEMARVAELTQKLPAWVLRLVMRFQHFFHFTLNTSLRVFGLPDDRFGSVMISNFGPLGLETGLVPLSPYCRCPLIIGIGRPRPLPIVRDGAVVVAECVNISFTFDHRYADGAHGAQMMKKLQKVFLNPNRFPEIFQNEATNATLSSNPESA